MGCSRGKLSCPMTRALNRRWSVATLSFAVASSSCIVPTDAGSGMYAYLGVIPSMSQDAIDVYRGIDDFGMTLNNVRVALTREDGSLAFDSTIAITPGQDSIVLELVVGMKLARERMEAIVELRDEALVVFSGKEPVELQRGGGARATTPMIVLDYTGPGALARVIEMNPRDTSIARKSALTYIAAPRDAWGQAIPNVPVSWTLSDPTAGDITTDGVFTPRGRGETWVIARLPTGLRDSAKVVVAK